MTRIPGIPYGPTPKAAGYASALSQPPKIIVVHCTSNTAPASGEASYAATRTDARGNWTSAHAYVDANGPLGSLDLGLQAWAAFGWANARGWHIELCGRENAVPDVVQRAGAALVRQLCQLASIPMEHLDGAAIRALHDGTRTRGGVTGHYDVTRSAIDANDHTDPGTNFDWVRFMSWVTEDQSTYAGEDDMGRADDILADTIQLDNALYSLFMRIVTGDDPYWSKLMGGAKFNDPLLARASLRALRDAVDAGFAANEARDKATTAAIDALAKALATGGGSVDSAAVIAHIDQVSAAESQAVTALQAKVADLESRLAAAAHASADALDG